MHSLGLHLLPPNDLTWPTVNSRKCFWKRGLCLKHQLCPAHCRWLGSWRWSWLDWNWAAGEIAWGNNLCKVKTMLHADAWLTPPHPTMCAALCQPVEGAMRGDMRPSAVAMSPCFTSDWGRMGFCSLLALYSLYKHCIFVCLFCCIFLAFVCLFCHCLFISIISLMSYEFFIPYFLSCLLFKKKSCRGMKFGQ